MNTPAYVHDEAINNLHDPRRILPIVFEFLRPRSIVDIGCGIGTFLAVAKELGAVRVTGIDGDWVDREMLFRNLKPDEFVVADLTRPLTDPVERADLALCLEVAEHIAQEHADDLVRTVVSASDVVLFSAAPPGQGGQNHVNEQWPDYWASRFAAHGYTFHDVVRPLIWAQSDISYWYRQNTFLVTSSRQDDVAMRFPRSWNPFDEPPLHLIHPDLFAEKTQSHTAHLEQIFSGRLRSRSYAYLLWKSLFHAARVRNRTHQS